MFFAWPMTTSIFSLDMAAGLSLWGIPEALNAGLLLKAFCPEGDPVGGLHERVCCFCMLSLFMHTMLAAAILVFTRGSFSFLYAFLRSFGAVVGVMRCTIAGIETCFGLVDLTSRTLERSYASRVSCVPISLENPLMGSSKYA